MPCQVCGAAAGRYPICRACHDRRASGAVAKCASCARWSEVSHGFCSTCLEQTLDLQPEQISSWARRTYGNAKSGLQYARDEETRKLLKEALTVAEEIYTSMGGREARTSVTARVQTLVKWRNSLSDSGTEGLARTQNEMDARRFVALNDVASEMAHILRSSPAEGAESNPAGPALLQRGTRLVTDREISDVITHLIQGAEKELLIVSPWIRGVENLVRELVRTSRNVRIRIVTRRPEDGDDGHRRTLNELNKDDVHFIYSPHVHAKLIIQDSHWALIGSANLVSTSLGRNQEAAILTSDETVVADAEDYFSRIYLAARAEMFGLR